MTIERIVFECGANFIETFIITWFYTLYLGSKYNSNQTKINFVIMWLSGFVEVCVLNSITIFESIASYIPMIRYFIYAILCLNGTILLKLWMAIITHIIVMITAIFTNLSICCIIDYSPSSLIINFDSKRIIAVVISKVVIFVCYFIILKNKRNNPIKSRLWYMLIIIPILSALSVCRLMDVALLHEDVLTYLTQGMLCIIASNIVVYYFYMVVSAEYENRLKLKLLEQQNENAKKQIDEADAFVSQMKGVRHDIKNHLCIIKSYLCSGNTADAQKYIDSLGENYLPHIQDVCCSGNVAFDGIMNAKIAVCKTKNIIIEVKIIKGLIDNIDYVDTGILFGNLMDNAIEACEKIENPKITVNIQKKGEYVSISVVNSIKDSVLQKNSKLITSKEDKELHGIGIKSIENIVKKRDGIINFFEEPQEFICSILLPL